MFEILKEHLSFRKQLVQLARADVARQHKGAALGWLWELVKPTIMIAVYWFAFTYGIRNGGEVMGHPFALFLVVGIVPWFYMSSMLTGGAGAIRKYKYLVTKMKFPVSTIPTFVNVSRLLTHLAMMAIVLIVLLFNGYKFDVYILQFPLYLILMFFFFNAWSLFSSVIVAFSKDFMNLIKSTTRVLFWISGILYSVDEIHVDWIRDIMRINPITFFVEGYRNTFLYGRWFYEDWKALIVFAIVMIVMVIASVIVYRKLRKQLVDVL